MSTIDPLNKANFSGITTMIYAKDVDRAAKFYEKTFGFEILYNSVDSNGEGYADMKFRDTKFMILEENLEKDKYMPSPKSINGGTASYYFYVEDVESVTNEVVEKGAELVMPPTMMPWGDKCSVVSDLDGHQWMIATHIEEVEMV